jgi:acyl-coenzyme A synthetase/AMP-(fatty) acid ligase
MQQQFLWLAERMASGAAQPCLIWNDSPTTYGEILARVNFWRGFLDEHQVAPGEMVTLDGDYSPATVSLLLALIDRGAIIVPLTQAAEAHRDEFLEAAEVEAILRVDAQDRWSFTRTGRSAANPLIAALRQSGDPGLVLFSSGSTGKSKAALHNFTHLLEKFKTPRQQMRTITFLLLDHIGGINTLLYTLSNNGVVISIQERDPEIVCRAIAVHQAEMLPTSPTFLNLLLMSHAYERYDLSSLKLVTYGTEVMPESTLARMHELFPALKLQQTYGLSELGILRSKSKDSGSLWVKVGGEGYETKVVDGILWIKAHSAMLGYLNAPSPFDAEGWFNTNDMVEVDGEYIRILGRKSEIINVGGQKVYPAEVESVLLQMENVADAVVLGEPHPITGNIVVARINLVQPEPAVTFRQRLRAFCRDRLASFKIPVKVEIVDSEQFNARYKRVRR